MNKIPVKKIEKLYFTYPNTVTVVCTKVKNKVFLMPAVWQIPLSYNPPLFGVLISPKRFTFKKLKLASDFSLNFFTFDYADLIVKLGSSSGKYINKVKEFNVKLSSPLVINSPLLKEAYVSIECVKKRKIKCGDHYLFIGEAKKIWHNPNYFTNGILNIKKAQPLLYLGQMTFTTTISAYKKCKKYKKS